MTPSSARSSSTSGADPAIPHHQDRPWPAPPWRTPGTAAELLERYLGRPACRGRAKGAYARWARSQLRGPTVRRSRLVITLTLALFVTACGDDVGLSPMSPTAVSAEIAQPAGDRGPLILFGRAMPGSNQFETFII